MQRQRGELVPIGEVAADLGGPMKSIRGDSPQARHHFTCFDRVNQLAGASEAAPRPGLHGAADGAVQPAPHQSRQPSPIQARQRPLQAHHVCHRGSQAPPRFQPAPNPGLGVHRSSTDREP